jgi:glycosyltransferase involved in cell wall biosynthesis
VSVVISTYDRCEDCKRAVASALGQDPPPLEVLVCDDGSTDGTQAQLESWQATEPRLRYLRMERNRGTPAPARNLGIAEAAGEWVAFLDDDDRWLPGKLAVQAPLLQQSGYDVVASDAIRSNGRRYFGLDAGPWRPRRGEIERANPIILSSCIARRRLLLDVHGFDEDPRVASVADYELWLRLADRGTKFVVLDSPGVDYKDQGGGRLSSALLQTQQGLLLVRLRRWRSAPVDRLVAVSALRESYFTLRIVAEGLATRVRR